MSALHTPIQDDPQSLSELRAKVLAEFQEVERQLAQIARAPKSPGLFAERDKVIQKKNALLAKLNDVKRRLRDANRQAYLSSADRPANATVGLFYQQFMGFKQFIEARLHWSELVIEDQKRIIEFLKARAGGETIAPSVPDDFETWRRECYDQHTNKGHEPGQPATVGERKAS